MLEGVQGSGIAILRVDTQGGQKLVYLFLYCYIVCVESCK